LIARVAAAVQIPVFGSGDCVMPGQIVARLRESGVSGVLVGRGALRNPWIFSQAAALAGPGFSPVPVTPEERGRFLLDYIDLLVLERISEEAGFRHVAPGSLEAPPEAARGRERWVVNKLRALGSWYTKGLDGGSQLRVAINSAESVPHLKSIIHGFFFETPVELTA